MIEQTSLQPERALTGASIGQSADIDLADAVVSDFPQVVWLRGDEPYLEAFSLDADAVMAELGIRRSRLTQISGRELRVGRMRIDRYIRPMYRPEDVQRYMHWSRATATHQKSSLVLKEAASRLEEQGSLIEDKIQTASREWVAQLTDHVDQQSVRQQRQVDALSLGLQEECRLSDERHNTLKSHIQDVQDVLVTMMLEGREALETLFASELATVVKTETLVPLETRLLELSESIDRQQKSVQDLQTTSQKTLENGLTEIQSTMSQLAEALTLIIHHQKDQAAKMDSAMQKRIRELTQEILLSKGSTEALTVGFERAVGDSAALGRSLVRSRQLSQSR